MGKTTTEIKVKSQEKNILGNISYQDFSAVCKEYQVVEKAVKELVTIADDTFSTETKDRISIYKWLVEMNIGKPKQITIPTETNTNPTPIVFDILDDKSIIWKDRKQLSETTTEDIV